MGNICCMEDTMGLGKFLTNAVTAWERMKTFKYNHIPLPSSWFLKWINIMWLSHCCIPQSLYSYFNWKCIYYLNKNDKRHLKRTPRNFGMTLWSVTSLTLRTSILRPLSDDCPSGICRACTNASVNCCTTGKIKALAAPYTHTNTQTTHTQTDRRGAHK